ncbi:MAG: hypothetical protein GX605_04865, partial [Chloroflexi bacterium]|nr:hypothetical protein [Chloroflexota bacterium]
MKTASPVLSLAVAFLLLAVSVSLPAQAAPPAAPGATPGSPLFIENVGQFAPGARFQMWGGPGTVWLAEDALWVSVV